MSAPPATPSVRPLLVVMRRANMKHVHPEMVVSLCDRCGHAVGIYPSGQRVLAAYPVLELVCEVCHGPVHRAMLAPGALEEKRESVTVHPEGCREEG